MAVIRKMSKKPDFSMNTRLGNIYLEKSGF